MSSLLPVDLQFVLRHVPPPVINVMKKNDIVLAGGYIRDLISKKPPCDIDLFPLGNSIPSPPVPFVEDYMGPWDSLFVQEKIEIIKTHKSHNAITYLSKEYLPIQLINRWKFDAVEEVINSFDFTICQVAIAWYKERDLFVSVCSDRFYPDLAAKRLYYTSPVRDEEAGGSMMRVRKFLSAGYNIQAESFGKVISRIVKKVDLPSIHEGIDVDSVVIGLLREVDPLNIINNEVVEVVE